MARPRKFHRKYCKYSGSTITEVPLEVWDCTCTDKTNTPIDEAAVSDDFAPRVRKATETWRTIYLEDPPEGFDAAMRALFLLGADDGLVTYAITVTATQLHIENKFAYMAGIIRNIIGRSFSPEEDDD